MKRLLLVLPVILAACEASSGVPTAPTPPQFSSDGPSTVMNYNYWYTNTIQWFDPCTPHQWVEGSVRSHVRRQDIFSGDTQKSAWHLNVAGGTLTDVDGGEYVFINHGEQRDDYVLQPFTFDGTATQSFVVISKGRELNQFFDLTIHYTFDGVTFVVTYTELQNCRGSER